MASLRANPNGIEQNMIVRRIQAPDEVYRVSGNPGTGRVTFVALSKGRRSVLNGNVRNYRPETPEETAAREGIEPEVAEPEVAEPEVAEPQPAYLHVVQSESEPAIELPDAYRRMLDAVAPLAEGSCTLAELSEIVSAAAELNSEVLAEYED